MVTETKTTDTAVKIEQALKVGESNAIKMRDLKTLIGKNDSRQIREIIEQMRLAGHLILSSSKGYWYCGSIEEFKAWHNFMYSYIQNLSHTVRLVGEAAIKTYGETAIQITMFK